jgi:hypothetical protein
LFILIRLKSNLNNVLFILSNNFIKLLVSEHTSLLELILLQQ